MINDESSPDPDITIRDSRAPLPTFDGVETLPTPLRELQRQEGGIARTPPQPSELTALAIRLRKIRLDVSPGGELTSSGNAQVDSAKPVRLDFDDSTPDPAHDKENVRNGVPLPEAVKPPRTPRSLEREFGLYVSENAPSEVSARGESVEQSQSEVSEAGEAPLEDVVASVDDIPLRDPHAQEPAATEVSEMETSTSNDKETTSIQQSPAALEKGTALSSANADDTMYVSQVDASVSDATDETAVHVEGDQQDRVNAQAAVTAEQGHDSTFLKQNLTRGTEENADASSNLSLKTCDPDDNSDYVKDRDSLLKLSTMAPSAAYEGDEDSQSKPSTPAPKAAHNDGSRRNIAKVEQSADEDITVLDKHLQKILEGKEKWTWPKRCEALSAVAQALTTSPSEEELCAIQKVLPILSSTVNDNLDELRPSVITSALCLVNAVVSSRMDEGSNFAEEVFPSVMDLACGRSLTAQEAAKSLALVLSFHTDLSSILEDADNPDRLCELLELEVSRDTDPVGKVRATTALKIVRDAVFKDATGEILPAPQSNSTDIERKESGVEPSSSTRRDEMEPVENTNHASADEPLAVDSAMVTVPSSPNLSSAMLSSLKIHPAKTPRQSRLSLRVEALPSSGIKSTPRQSFRGRSSELRSSTPLVRNMKLGDTVRKVSPASARKRRMYTEEEMEEARRAAMRVVMEETSQAHAKEREKHREEKELLEKRLRKEQSEVKELKEVLEEYELTMQKMVSQGNSQASAYCASLEKETKKLKAELLEVTDAYENIKELYDAGKQALKVYENKESRNIEQIRELKKNMAVLQKWSNDLRANTEKKLTKAFENVTTYRASYMDKEAHLSKATSDLERARSELEKEVTNHAGTAAALSRLEALLHNEQDARSSLEASLSTSKASLVRITAQKDRLQKDLNSAQDQLKQVSDQLSTLKDADARATDAVKRLETFTVASQSLKARAYDDMTRIRALETELEAKEKEYEELSSICEEALSQLEKLKKVDAV